MPKTLVTARSAGIGAATAPQSNGVWLGLLGMLIFSLTLPATRLAVTSVDALIVGLSRSLVALPCAVVALFLTRGGLPPRASLGSLSIVTLGNVFGFPIFSALALFYSTASHAAVIFGIMPLVTALMGALRAGERMSLRFWLFSLIGALITAYFSFDSQHNGTLGMGDFYACVAVLLGCIGYAEGGVLARRFGPMRVQAWALLLGSVPVALLLGALVATRGFHPDASACVGLLYIGVFSSFIGFIPWNAGLANGGVARIGQILLVQPLFTIMWSALLLKEPVDKFTIVAGVAVCLCAAFAVRRSPE